MLDFYHATRDELIRVIRDQRDSLVDAEQQLAAQPRELAEIQVTRAAVTARLGTLPGEAEAAPGPPKGMPGHKPTQTPVRDRQPRKRRGPGRCRSQMQATAQIIHALVACPDCGAPLTGGSQLLHTRLDDIYPGRCS